MNLPWPDHFRQQSHVLMELRSMVGATHRTRWLKSLATGSQVPPLCRSGSKCRRVRYADLADGVDRSSLQKKAMAPRSAGSRSVSGIDTGRYFAGMPGGKLDIKRSGSQPSGKGPAEWFTGTVRIDPLFQAPDPARVAGASVTFEPGARTAWHTHPLGQTLIVTAGCGLAQRWGGPIEEIRPGDVVWFPPGEKHWHGATPTTAMTHIAIQETARRQGRGLDGASQRRTVCEY